MALSDPIADFLTRIRNGLHAELPAVNMPGSRVKSAICKVLLDEGYISGFDEHKDGEKPILTVELKYFQGKPVIEKIDRVSRPGRRWYVGKADIPEVRGGFGIAIISTNKGILAGQKAAEAGVGGEILCTVY